MTTRHASLSHAELSVLRDRLLAERQTLRDASAIPSVVTDAPPRESDVSDEATDDLAQHEGLSESQHAQQRLAEVDAALARIEAGTYGMSERSGEPIGYARLSAVPWTRLTAAEQEELESRASP
jgi:DnaK suppressor protein